MRRILVLILVLLPLGALAQDTSEEDRGFIQGLIEDALSDTSREVRLENFQGALSSRATVDRIVVTDAEGPWLILTDVALAWNRSRLLSGAIDIEELSAARIEITRQPLREASLPSPEAQGFSLPDLPVSVEMREIEAGEIVLGESILGEALTATFAGDITLIDRVATADLRLERTDGKLGRFVIEAAFDDTARALGILLEAEEGPAGIAARTLGLPGRPALRLSVAGDAPLDDFTADLALATDGTDRLTGAVTLTAEGAPEAPDRRFSATLSGDIRPLLEPDYRRFFGPRSALDLAGTAHADGRLDLSDLTIEAAEIALTGSLSLGPDAWPERFALAGRVGSDTGDPVLLPVAGGATFVQSMLLDIGFDAAAGDRWSGTFRLNDFRQPGVAIRVLEMDGGGLIQAGDSAPVGRFTADLRYGARGLALEDPALAEAIGTGIVGQIDLARVAGNPLVLRRLTMRGPGVEFDGSAFLRGPADGLWTRFDLTARTEDFARFSGLAGLDLQGAGEVTLSGDVTPLEGSAELRVRASTTGLAIGIAALDGLLAEAGSLSFDLSRDDTGSRLRDLRLTNGAIAAEGDVFLSSRGIEASLAAGLTDLGLLSPQLSGPGRIVAEATQDDTGVVVFDAGLTAPGAEVAARATATPTDEAAFVIDGTARAAIDALGPWSDLIGQELTGAASGEATGRFDTATGAFDGAVDARLTNLSPGMPQVARILAGTGRVALQARREPGGRLRLEGIDADFPNLSARREVTSDTTTRARLDLRLADIGLIAPDFSGPVTASVDAEQDTGGWRLEASARGPVGTAAQARGRIGTGGRLDLALSGSAPLALLNGFIAPQQLSGLARFDLALNGPAALQSLSGTVTISEARLSAPQLRQALQDVNGTLSLAGGRATLALAGSGADGGRIDVAGPVILSPPFTADLAVGLAGLPFRDPSLYETTIDGQISVRGPIATGAAIGGRLNLGPVEMRVPSSTIGALGDLPGVTHVAPPPAVRLTLDRAGLDGDGAPEDAGGGGAGAAWPLDITVSAPSRIFVRGRGLDAELGGSLQLTGSTARIVPIGRFDLIRGRLDILGQRFVLNEGYAQLQGDFTPFLFLQARTEAENGTEVRIIVEGRVTEPEIRFESSPELPQDEVLSQLVFGRDLSSISPFQAVQLASAIGTLSGRGGGVLDDLRRGLDVDDFDVTSDDDGTVAVRAGKYISENVYTDVTIGGDGRSEINLNLDVTNDLSARGSVATDGETSVGIFYERDY